MLMLIKFLVEMVEVIVFPSQNNAGTFSGSDRRDGNDWRRRQR